MALSQATLPHKRFILTLVRHRLGVSLPMELDFSLGMRKCLVLFIEDLGVFSKFWAELGHYALPELGAGMELLRSSWRSLESNNNLNVSVLMRLLEEKKGK